VGSPVSADADCWTLVVNDLCRQVACSGEMNLNSNKDVQRDYVSISYICDVLSQVITDDSLSNVLAGRVSNMSSGKSISLGDLASLIQECSQATLGVLPRYRFSAVARDDQEVVPLNISSNLESIIDLKSGSDLPTEINNLLLNCQDWFGS